MPSVSHTLVPLSSGDLDSTKPYGGTSTIPNLPPYVSTPIPNQSVFTGNAFTYNASGNFTDPEGGALTFTQTGAPGTIDINLNTGVFSGSSTATGSYDITVTAEDPGGLTVDDTFRLSVSEQVTTDKPWMWPAMRCQYTVNRQYDTFGNNAHPNQKVLAQLATYCVMQGISIYTAGSRQVLIDNWSEYWAGRHPQQRMGAHIDIRSCTVKFESQTWNLNYAKHRYIFTLGHPEALISSGTTDSCIRQTTASSPQRSLAINTVDTGFVDWWMNDIIVDDLGNNDGFMLDKISHLYHDGWGPVLRQNFGLRKHRTKLISATGTGRKTITMNDWAGAPLSYPQFSGVTVAVSSGSNSSTWSSVPAGLSNGDMIRIAGAGSSGGNLDTTVTNIAGNTVTLANNAGTTVTAAKAYDREPDADGYYGLTSTYMVWWTNKEPAPTNSQESRIISKFKHNGDGTCTFVVTDDLPSAVQPGWLGGIFKASGDTKCAKWDGVNQSCPNPRLSAQSGTHTEYWRNTQMTYFFNKMEEKIQEVYDREGITDRTDFGRCCNAVSGGWLTKWNSGLDEFHAHYHAADIVMNENFHAGRSGTHSFKANQGRDGYQGYRYSIQSDVDREFYIGSMEHSLTYLRPGTPGANNVKGVILHYDIDDYVNVNGGTDETDAMYAGFFEMLSLCAGNGVHMSCTSHGLNLGFCSEISFIDFYSQPVTPATFFDATPTEHALSYAASWDENANDEKGDCVLRASDWGTGGGRWETWFPANPAEPKILGWIVLQNFGDIAAETRNWIPSHLPGGVTTTAADVYTVHDIDTGYRVSTWDPATYTNQFLGMAIRSGFIANPDNSGISTSFGRDDVLYPSGSGIGDGVGYLVDGTGQNGATLTLGVGSVQVLVIHAA